jgi:hypothetical protein
VPLKPFYRLAGGLYEPQTPATNAWSRAHQNGVAVGGLLAFLCEAHQPAEGFRTCRLTIDIQRAVPLAPLLATCRTLRDGGRLQLIETELSADGVPVARAAAVRLRTGASPPSPDQDPPYPPPEAAGDTPITRVLGAGAPVETRVISGREDGRGAFWARINTALVEGEPIPPIARAVMAADLASGPASLVDRHHWSFANVDLSVYLARPPAGEWVFGRCETLSAGDGTAIVTTTLADRAGPIGQASQTLYMAKMASAP